MLWWWNCQSPVTDGCSLPSHPNSFCREIFELNADLMQIHCSTRSVILNGTVTQYTCSLNSISCPHWLVRWSHHYSCMHIPVHSAWLPGYINVRQTVVLVILTMAGSFVDRPFIWSLLVHPGLDDWENCVRSQGAYFEGDWASLSYVPCFLYLVSSSTNVSIFPSTWLDNFRTCFVLCTVFLVSCIFFNKYLYFSYYMAE